VKSFRGLEKNFFANIVVEIAHLRCCFGYADKNSILNLIKTSKCDLLHGCYFCLFRKEERDIEFVFILDNTKKDNVQKKYFENGGAIFEYFDDKFVSLSVIAKYKEQDCYTLFNTTEPIYLLPHCFYDLFVCELNPILFRYFDS